LVNKQQIGTNPKTQNSEDIKTMDLQGNVTLGAPTDQVWQALNNPEVLRVCIPGCEEITALSPTEMQARVVIKMGPVRATFVGKVSMTNIVPMQGYTLNFEGSGGSAGFAKGSSVISLSAVPEGTQLSYTVKASIAGKLGQIGARMIDASARQLADKFFNALKEHFSAQHPAALVPVHGAQQTITTQNTAPAQAPSSHLPALSQATSNSNTAKPSADWLALEKVRLLWFAAGVVSTSIGVWLGASFLK
jgi:carbon monoxide dehydrogenase subunit G